MILAAALTSLVVRLLLEQDLTVLLASLTLIPVATARYRALDGEDRPPDDLGGLVPPIPDVELHGGPFASEERLFSHEQARRFALAYAGLTLAGLLLAVPYWRLLGIL
jgi:hypothetical protein